MSLPRPLALVLVCDDDALVGQVRACCHPQDTLTVMARQGLLDEMHVFSAHGAQIVAAAVAADAVLLEWEIADAPALNTLCYHLRRTVSTPALMIASDDPDVRAACIAAGADDTVAMPLPRAYVEARVLAYHRLVQAARNAPAVESLQPRRDTLRFGDLRIDRTAHRFFVREVEVALTPREFGLIEYLVSHADALCTRDQILSHVWGLTFDTGTNMVDVYMYFLRRKLEAYGLKGMIETVRGLGYRLAQPQAA